MKHFYLLLFCGLLCAATMTARAQNGTAGSLSWEISNGTLTISGTGVMPDYRSEATVPWYSHCNLITGTVIGDGVTSIGNYAFSYCYRLTSVTIPNSVASIGEFAFFGCTGLASVAIPASVMSIGERAFGACSELTSIDVDADNPNYSSDGGALFNKARTQLIQYPGGKTGAYVIPASVTSIGGRAFHYCSGLTSVTVPESVASIGEQAFYYCGGLTEIVNRAVAPQAITSYVFAGMEKSACTLLVPAVSIDAYRTAEGWKEFMNVEAINVPVGGVNLNKTVLTLVAGDAEQLTATVIPADVTNSNVTWASSNPAIAEVSNDGTVTAIAAGTATVTVTTQDGAETATCIVTVTKPVTGIILNKTVLTLVASDTEQLTATVTPADATSSDVTWASSNPAIAAVSDDGTVTAIAAGTATVTATANDGGKTASCTVTVESVTGMSEFAAPNLKMYPNPFAGTLHLTAAEGCTLRVVNALGTVVHTQKIANPDEMIRLEHLPAGVYFFRLEKNGQTKTVKAVKN